MKIDPKILEDLFFSACKEYDDNKKIWGVYSDQKYGTVDGHLEEPFWTNFATKINLAFGLS